MNYIWLIQDQVPVNRARLLSVVFQYIVFNTRKLVQDLAKSLMISHMKSHKIPNNISYEISQNPKWYLRRDLVSSRTHMNIWLCMRHEISYRISQNRTMHGTIWNNISESFFFSHYSTVQIIYSNLFNYLIFILSQNNM